jgi:citrate synthase
MWLSAEDALDRLQVKAQTLYANVSRGRVRARPDPADPRRSLYHSDDVDRLARKSAGRRPAEAVSAEAMHWGDPILESSISTIVDGQLFYRGQDAVELSQKASFEEVAQLLWQSNQPPSLATAEADGQGIPGYFDALAARVLPDPPTYGRSQAALRADAASVLGSGAAAIAGPGNEPIHVRLANRWGAPAAADPIRRALVVLADHELNASTFAARVTVSTGASLAAGMLAGLATLTGPLHGSAAAALFPLVRRAQEIGPDPAVRERLAEGRPIPAFGHRLYPLGDPRYTALMPSFVAPQPYPDLAQVTETLVGERPNIDFALAALTAAFNLPETAPIEIFALSRSVGWLAHMLEQAESGALIRPRARYVGIRPRVTLAPQMR